MEPVTQFSVTSDRSFCTSLATWQDHGNVRLCSIDYCQNVTIARNADDYIFCYQGWNFLDTSLLDDVPFLVQSARETRTKGSVGGYSILHDPFMIEMRPQHCRTVGRVFGLLSIKPEHRSSYRSTTTLIFITTHHSSVSLC